MTHPADSLQNHLLACLPEAEIQRLLPQLESVDLPLGKVLYGLPPVHLSSQSQEGDRSRAASQTAQRRLFVRQGLIAYFGVSAHA